MSWWSSFIQLVEHGEVYLVLLPAYVGLILGERVWQWAKGRHRGWNLADSGANVVITLGYLGLDVVLGGVLPLAVIAWLHAHLALFELGFGPAGWAAAFLMYDFIWYLDHRLSHRVGLFWAMHQVHHSSREFDMTVASRGFVLDNTLLPRPLFFLLPLFGFSPLHFLVVKILTSLWGIAQHTREVGKLGPLDALMATPSNHRVHHGSDPEYQDRNYGEVLMIWDHLFGTYQAEDHPPTYGVTEPLETHNPLKIELAGLGWLRQKWRRMPTLRDKVHCLWRPPGWEPS